VKAPGKSAKQGGKGRVGNRRRLLLRLVNFKREKKGDEIGIQPGGWRRKKKEEAPTGEIYLRKKGEKKKDILGKKKAVMRTEDEEKKKATEHEGCTPLVS